MGIEPRALAIGLTGPFGSGCTTAATELAQREQFTVVRLSAALLKAWEGSHPGKKPKRGDLQTLGDEMRTTSKDAGILAHKGIESLHTGTHSRIVFDGIRNVGEIRVLRETFGYGFYLFALGCPLSDRWERLKPTYEAAGRTAEDFARDDQRDRDEDDRFGQQVDLCVDRADVLLSNDDSVPPAMFRSKLLQYLHLITGEKPRFATDDETRMNLCYSAAHGSKCLKRHVGALLVNDQGAVVGQGYNENPRPTKPCVEEPRYGASDGNPGKCYRDIVRLESYQALQGRYCPACGKTMGPPKAEPPWRCSECGNSLEEFFWPERAMSFCTAIHAEVAAILGANGRERGATLYTTTFPCFQCAEKLIQVGVKEVVFTETYPDVEAARRLEIAGVKQRRFEGIRSSRFDEIFSDARHA